MREKKGKRFDGVIKGSVNTYFEYKTSKFVFPNESGRPCVKIFYDDHWKLLQTIRYTENHSKHIYVMKNNRFEGYSEYIAIEIDLENFSKANEIEKDRLIFYLDNPCIKSLEEYLKENYKSCNETNPL